MSKLYPIEITRPYPIKVSKPYPIKITISVNKPYLIEKPVPVAVKDPRMKKSVPIEIIKSYSVSIKIFVAWTNLMRHTKRGRTLFGLLKKPFPYIM